MPYISSQKLYCPSWMFIWFEESPITRCHPDEQIVLLGFQYGPIFGNMFSQTCFHSFSPSRSSINQSSHFPDGKLQVTTQKFDEEMNIRRIINYGARLCQKKNTIPGIVEFQPWSKSISSKARCLSTSNGFVVAIRPKHAREWASKTSPRLLVYTILNHPEAQSWHFYPFMLAEKFHPFQNYPFCYCTNLSKITPFARPR